MLTVRIAIFRAAFSFIDLAARAASEAFTMLDIVRSALLMRVAIAEEDRAALWLIHPPRKCKIGQHRFRMRAGYRLIACERCGRVQVRREK